MANYRLPHVLLTDGTPPTNIPDAVNPLPGWLVEADDGQVPGVVMHDEYFEDRATYLNQTNEIFAHRPVNPEGLLGFFVDMVLSVFGQRPSEYVYNVLGIRISPTGKIICRVDIIYAWMQWIIDLLGERNAGHFVNPGNGFCDTDADNTPIDGSQEIKLMAAATGGNLVKITGSHLQAGIWYDFIETFDYYNPPVKGPDGVWRVNGVAYSWETHPYLFVSRVNRVVTKIITWITRNGINAATDGGLVGGAGDQHWPCITNKPAAQPRNVIARYPELPVMLTIYKDSLVVDGNLVARSGGLSTVVDAYMFYGSSTYVRSVDGNWYIAEEMLVTADAAQGEPGNGFDWRVYASLDGKEPYMNYRSYRVPVCGWVRL